MIDVMSGIAVVVAYLHPTLVVGQYFQYPDLCWVKAARSLLVKSFSVPLIVENDHLALQCLLTIGNLVDSVCINV